LWCMVRPSMTEPLKSRNLRHVRFDADGVATADRTLGVVILEGIDGILPASGTVFRLEFWASLTKGPDACMILQKTNRGAVCPTTHSPESLAWPSEHWISGSVVRTKNRHIN
jgi:hypothetical protein